MFQAVPGYQREFYLVPPYADLEAAEAEREAREAADEKPKIEIDFSDLEQMPSAPGPVLKAVPAHLETDPETGLLVFKPISFVTLTPPPVVEDKIEDDVEVEVGESDDDDDE